MLLLLPAWLAFVLYLPTLEHGLVWDDIYFLVDTPNLRDPALWWDAVRQPLFVSVNYFRPLPLLSFVAELRLGGVSPFVFHLSNLLLHAANTTLVVLLARALLGNAKPLLAALAGVLFAIHPALVENVSWVSDRFDLMMMFFLLSAFLAERRLSHSFGRAAAIALLFLAALLCKETAVVFLGLLPLWQMMRIGRDETWKQALQRFDGKSQVQIWLALSASLALYISIRYASLGFFYHGDAQMSPGSILQHALLIGKTLGWYAVMAFWPFGQMGPVHPALTPLPLSDGFAWLGLAAVTATLAWIAWACRRPPARPVLLFSMALLALAPASNLVPLTIGDNLVHDRFLILPLALASIGLVLLLETVRLSWSITTLLAVWCAAAALTVANLIPHWENNISLWGWAYKNYPNSDIAGPNYVAALVNAERYEETVSIAQALLRQGPQAFNITQNMALAEARLGHFELAERDVRRVIKFLDKEFPDDHKCHSEAFNLLALIQMSQHRYAPAETPLRAAIALTPYGARPHFNLALVLYESGDWEGGDRELALALRYGSPDSAATFARLGAEKRRQKQTELGVAAHLK